MNEATRRTVRGWAWFDLSIGAVMALPPIAQAFLALLYAISNRFGASHDVAAFPALGLMLMSMAGALIIVWALARLLHPDRQLATIDTLARAWVGGLIGWFVLFQDVPTIIIMFVIGEWAGAVHQGIMLSRQGTDAPGQNTESVE